MFIYLAIVLANLFLHCRSEDIANILGQYEGLTVWFPEGVNYFYHNDKPELYDLDELTHIFNKYHEDPLFHKWMEYAPLFDDHIKHLKRKPMVKMLEIGVQSGGSTIVWPRYFGADSVQYVGIDINPNCKQFETERVRIEIGSQTDEVFLRDICAKYGPFNFITDDGAHTTEAIIASFNVLWSCMADNGVYAIEDLHTMNYWDGPDMLVDGKDVYGFLGDLARKQVTYYSLKPELQPPDPVGKHIKSITIYDSLAFIRYQEDWKRFHDFQAGKTKIDYVYTPP